MLCPKTLVDLFIGPAHATNGWRLTDSWLPLALALLVAAALAILWWQERPRGRLRTAPADPSEGSAEESNQRQASRQREVLPPDEDTWSGIDAFVIEEPQGCEILVIDDDESSREVLRWMLGEEDYHVHEARDGDEALRILERSSMDLVILDIHMPGLSGYEVCRSIRNNFAVDELPILFVTGHNSLESLHQGFEVGGNDYLAKPVSREELVARVKFHLSTLSTMGYRRRLREAVQISREERELRRQLFDARERERRRLAQELHDGPIQDLNALVLALRRHPEDLKEQVGRLHEVMADLRAMCTELRPPALVFGGLSGALEIHVVRLQERHPSIDIRMALMPDGEQLTEWNRLQLFRIAQEALSNAIQHGRPQRIRLGFELDAEGCCLWVRDDGCGFEVPERWIELARKEHFGLVGMAERAESMGAKLILESTPGRGTESRVEVPWPESAEDQEESADDYPGEGD